MNGKPCIRNLCITVDRVPGLICLYPDKTELYAEFPELEEEDIKQAILFAESSSQNPTN